MNRQSQFVFVDPIRSARAKNIPDYEWELWKTDIERWHGAGFSKGKIRAMLKNEGFHPSTAQLVSRMRKWRLDLTNRGAGLMNQNDYADDSHADDRPSTTASQQTDVQSREDTVETSPKEYHRQARRVSYDSSTPPATDSASSTTSTPPSLDSNATLSDQGSLDDGDRSQRRVSGEVTTVLDSDDPYEIDEMLKAHNAVYKKVSATVGPLLGYHPSPHLNDLWPSSKMPSSLTAGDLADINKKADFLFAAKRERDAFDLYYLDFRCWHSLVQLIPTAEAIRNLLKAVINCARSCFLPDQILTAKGMLEYAIDLLKARGYNNSLDLALMYLYLAAVTHNSPYSSGRPCPCCTAKSGSTFEESLRIAVRYSSMAFSIIDAGIHDREILFFSKSIRTGGYGVLGSAARTYLNTARSMRDFNGQAFHFRECRRVYAIMKELLRRCKRLIYNGRKALDEIINVHQAMHDPSIRQHAPRVLLAYCTNYFLKDTSDFINAPLDAQDPSEKCEDDGCLQPIEVVPALGRILDFVFRPNAPAAIFDNSPTSGRASKFSIRCINRLNLILSGGVSVLADLCEDYYTYVLEPACQKPMTAQPDTDEIVMKYAVAVGDDNKLENLFLEDCQSQDRQVEKMTLSQIQSLSKSAAVRLKIKGQKSPTKAMDTMSKRSSVASQYTISTHSTHSSMSVDQRSFTELADKLNRTSLTPTHRSHRSYSSMSTDSRSVDGSYAFDYPLPLPLPTVDEPLDTLEEDISEHDGHDIDVQMHLD